MKSYKLKFNKIHHEKGNFDKKTYLNLQVIQTIDSSKKLERKSNNTLKTNMNKNMASLFYGHFNM